MSEKPAAPAAPAAPASNKSPRATLIKPAELSFSSGVVTGADRIIVYGAGGIGKSTLCAHLPAPGFLDAERGTRKLNVARDNVNSWIDLRGKVNGIAAAPPSWMRSLVVDTATAAEEFAKEYVVATRKTEKGKAVDSIEGFGWGKGWQFVCDEVNGLLSDLERVQDQGINVCLIAHEIASPVPNPGGEDYIRWEPHLYSGDKKGRGSIRDRVKQWADHVLFVGYDVHVEDGKGQGSGTRTIYTKELPTHIAKARGPQTSFAFTESDPGAVWRALEIS